MIERLFIVKTLRSKSLGSTDHLRVKRARPEHTFIDSLRVHSFFKKKKKLGHATRSSLKFSQLTVQLS